MITGMRLRVVDYVASIGGGVRFSVELIRALLPDRDLSIEIVSDGPGLRVYRELLSDKVAVRYAEIVADSPRFLRV